MSQSADRAVDSRLAGPRWKGFYIIGGVAALIAVVFFRRNFGVELIGFRGFDILDVPATHPGSAFDWCRLLQDDALAALALLNMYAALRQWRTLIQERGNSERRKADFCGIICIGRSTLMNSTRIGVMRLFLLSGQPYSEEANMDQARVRFEQYLKRRFGQSSTLKHYISDLNIFIDAVDNKAPERVTAEDIDTFVDQQIAAELSPATINRRLASLHTFFEYLASEKPECDWPNPILHRRHRLKTGSHLPRDVPGDDVARLSVTRVLAH